jgi:hypothetical protein
MKKTDIAMIILIASVSVIIALFVAGSIFPSAYKGSVTVKTIDKIDSEVTPPNTDIFNKNAINPTVQVKIDGTK